MQAYCASAMRVAVLTTSYPRHAGDVAGAFVENAVQNLRSAGVEIEVVSPAGFRDFGIAYGDGIAANLTSNPARAALLPAFLASYARAARRAARNADLVHAHWLPTGFPASFAGKPFVLTLHGTDVELARHGPVLARRIVRRAAVVIGVSRALTHAASNLGARDARFVPNGVEVPAEVTRPADPPSVLFAGRLSPEKWIAAGQLPTTVDALARLEHLTKHGPSDHAFGWESLRTVRLWMSQRCA